VGSLSQQRGQGGSWAGGVLLGNTYLLGQRISLGGMGEVFEATHARLPGRYAVKILRTELLGNREAFARFCREAEVMSELRHPNVVQIYDFNTTPEGRPYFVMEHLEGRDLEARLTQSGPMPLPAAVRVVDAVASALATAHSHGIVHRDLKPANIFLVAIDGQIDELVKVLDFGISKIRSAGTLLSSPTDMIGSPAYMSPEQARGAADEIDGRSDQFALGAITYRMLTGFDPFRGDDIASLLYQVVHEEAPRLAHTLPSWWDTRALQAVLDRALAKDPAQRFNGMMELARAFEAASEQTLSHEMVERGTVNLGATLIAAPPPPPLRPARTPAAAEAAGSPVAAVTADRPPLEPGDIEDSAPPIRTPAPEPMGSAAAVAPSRAPAPRPRRSLDFSTDDGATMPAGSPPRGVDWEEPYLREQLPVTHHRVALAALALLALAAILGVTGIYRHIISGGRRALGLAHPVPAETAPPASAPPASTNAAPPVESPVPGPAAPSPPAAPTPAPETTAPAAKPAPAEAAPERPRPAKPSKPTAPADERSAPAAHSHRHHMSTEPRIVNRPGSVYLPSTPPPPVDDQFNPLVQPPGAAAPSSAPAPRQNPFAQPPSAPPPPPARPNSLAQPPSAPPPPDTLQNQFSIPPPAPTEDSPSRDIVPPPAPERELGPAVSPAPAPAPRTNAPPGPPTEPRPRGPADQPMAPSF
jgi:serine/threonine-protein kinase